MGGGGGQNSLWGKKRDKATKQLKGYKTVRRRQQNRWGGGVRTAYKIVSWVKTDKATKHSVGYRTD